MFPGNQLLLITKGVQVLATPEGVQAVKDDVESEMHWMRRGVRSVESTINHRYSSDPMVLRLLDLYLDAVRHYDDSDDTSRNLSEADIPQPWPGSK